MPDKVEEGFIRVEDKIYSAEKLANFHPGGPIFVKVINMNILYWNAAAVIGCLSGIRQEIKHLHVIFVIGNDNLKGKWILN